MKKFLLSIMMLAACGFAMSADELTISDGTSTSSNLPFYGMWMDTAGTKCQMYYDADSLTAIPEGATITGIKFYPTSSTPAEWDATRLSLSMGTVDALPWTSAYGASAVTEGLTVVATDVQIPAGSTEVTFEFTEPFVYEGGNLIFSNEVTTGGGYKTSYFYGTSGDAYTSWYRNNVAKFVPKTTFIYTTEVKDYDAFVSPKSLDFGKMPTGESVTLEVTVKNRGAQAFTPSTNLAAPFSTTYTPAELASGESVVIPVTFAPTEEGEFAATMNIDCGQAPAQTVELTGVCSNAKELTVSDGTLTSTELPYKGTYIDTEGTFGQMIYNADMLTDVVGKQILGIRFYNKEAVKGYNAKMEVCVGPIEDNAYEFETAITAPTNLASDLTVVNTDALKDGTNEWEITFDEPYLYEGGNLAVQTKVTQKGTSYQSTAYYGSNQADYVGYASWGSTLKNTNFLPKMTVIYKDIEEATVTVAGTVTDTNQQPLEGVEVTLTVTPATKAEPATYTAATDVDGAFSMDVTPVDGATYSLNFSKDGYKTVNMNNVDIEQDFNVVMEETGTGINNIVNAAEVARVRYINAMGQMSDKPFEGVNIVVVEMKDGTKTTTKIVK